MFPGKSLWRQALETQVGEDSVQKTLTAEPIRSIHRTTGSLVAVASLHMAQA